MSIRGMDVLGQFSVNTRRPDRTAFWAAAAVSVRFWVLEMTVCFGYKGKGEAGRREGHRRVCFSQA